MVNVAVGLVAFPVLVGIFNCGDSENDNEREDDKTRRDSGERREELEDGDAQEETTR